MRKYKHLIFDLDDTLMDTWGQLVKVALTEACNAMIRAGLKTDIDTAVAFRSALYKEDPRCDFWKALVEKFGVNEGIEASAVSEIGDHSFHHRNVKEEIRLFPGAREMLERLQNSYKVSLVTAGSYKTQTQKVSRLDIEILFTEIYCVDPSQGMTKLDAFRKILNLSSDDAGTYLVIGNRLDHEIRMGKSLGMDTCYMKHGEYIHMSPSCPEEEADFVIGDITDLEHLLEMPESFLTDLKKA